MGKTDAELLQQLRDVKGDAYLLREYQLYFKKGKPKPNTNENKESLAEWYERIKYKAGQIKETNKRLWNEQKKEREEKEKKKKEEEKKKKQEEEAKKEEI